MQCPPCPAHPPTRPPQVAFVATGEGKAVVLRHIFDARVPLADSLPSARVRQCDTQPATWFLDAPAAALLH